MLRLREHPLLAFTRPKVHPTSEPGRLLPPFPAPDQPVSSMRNGLLQSVACLVIIALWHVDSAVTEVVHNVGEILAAG
jgi:hypothetical protein